MYRASRACLDAFTAADAFCTVAVLNRINIHFAYVGAFAASDAVGGGGGILAHGGAHGVIHQPPEFALGITAVVGRKGAGNVHIPRSGHTVTAAGAAHLHLCIDGLDHAGEHFRIRRGKLPDGGGAGGLDVFAHHGV